MDNRTKFILMPFNFVFYTSSRHGQQKQSYSRHLIISTVSWLVVLDLTTLGDSFSLYRAVSKREGEIEESIIQTVGAKALEVYPRPRTT